MTLYSLRHQAATVMTATVMTATVMTATVMMATVMIDAGIDAKTVSERLGNSVTTVLTTCTHLHAARTTADAPRPI